ncbi:MAG: YbhB/YbcL family Raf kinase inhibitor-like protein [Acidobacteria bacterium]|nr:YbhB/YbcL family Raf kinase inhibitor-like protein [Acidobacteriota bacterium]
MALQLTIEAFVEGAVIPKQYTCDGADRSPGLAWSGGPAGTRSFALIMDDPDAPVGTWNHWLLYDLPAEVHELPEGFRPGDAGVSGLNDFGKPGYGGPCPPARHGTHRYFFKLYALDVPSLGLKAGARRAELDQALHGHVIGEARYMGKYERK